MPLSVLAPSPAPPGNRIPGRKDFDGHRIDPVRRAAGRWLAALLVLWGPLVPRSPAESPIRTVAELPSSASLVAWSISRQQLVYVDAADRSVRRLPLSGGSSVRLATLEQVPTCLTASPDGRWIFVGSSLPDGEIPGAARPGWIDAFDLESDSRVGPIAFTNAPNRILATDDRVLVVGYLGPLRFAPELRLVDMKDGRMGPPASYEIYAPDSYLTLDPSQRSFFAAGFRISSRPVCRVFFDPGTLEMPDFRVSPERPGTSTVMQRAPFASSNGLLVTFPYAYRSSTDAFEDMRYFATLDVSAGLLTDAVFDDALGAFALAGTAGMTFHRYDDLSMFRFVEWPWIVTAARLGDQVFAVAGEPGAPRKLIAFPNPSSGLPDNTPPQANLTWTPTEPTTRDRVTLDASLTRDDQDPTSALRFRWDLDGDGRFDTEWASTPHVEVRFPEPRAHTVTLLVQDRFNASHSVTKTIAVSLQEDPGEPGPSGDPFTLNLRLKRAVFQGTTPILYGLPEDGRSLIRWNLDDGRADRVWRFDVPVVDLALTPDGRHLWLAHSTHDAEAVLPPLKGSISKLDTARGAIVHEFRIPANPSDLVATDNGLIFVVATDPRRTVQFIDGNSGSIVGTEVLNQLASLALHPSQSRLYIPGEANPPEARRLEFDPTTGQRRQRRVYPLALPPELFVLPGGSNLLTQAGTLIRLSEAAATDMTVVRDLPVGPIRGWVDLPDRALVALLESDFLTCLDATTLEPWLRQPVPPHTLAVGRSSDRLHLVVVEESGSRLLSRRVPARTAAENLPPTIAWGSTSDPLLLQLGAGTNFEARPVDEDGRIEAVVFEVDGVEKATVAEPPYVWSWTPETAGRFEVRAVARDNLGATRPSVPVVVTVNAPPTLAIESPAAGDALLSPANFVARARATDPDGTVASVEWSYQPPFGFGAVQRLGIVDLPPFELPVTDFVGHGGTLQAVATDDLGGRTVVGIPLRVLGRAGDAFERPLLLSGTEAAGMTDTRSATMEPFEPRWFAVPQGSGSVWWRWSAPGEGWVTLTTDGSTFDTVLEVLTNGVINQLRPLDDNDDDPGRIPWSRVKVPVGTGGDLRIRLYGSNPFETGDAALRLTFHPRPAPGSGAPANDDRARATVVSGVPAETSGTNVGATQEPGDPAFGLFAPNRTVWWIWEAPSDGRFEWSTEGSGFDTLLGVLTQRPEDPEPTAWVSNDDAPEGGTTSRVRVSVTTGTRCFVVVGGFAGDQGRVTLRVQAVPDLPPTPTNDAFAAAAPLGPGSVTVRANNTGATTEPEEPNFRGRAPGPTVWWRWKAARTGSVSVKIQSSMPGYSTEPTASAMRIGVYQGTRLPDLRTVAESQPSANAASAGFLVKFDAVQDEEYLLRASTENTGRPGEFFLGVNDGLEVDPVRLEWRGPPGASTARVRVRTPYPRTLAIEASRDLLRWTEVWRRPVTGTADADIALDEGASPLFLRARSRD